METLHGLVRMFFDPIGIISGVLVVGLTMLILQRIYNHK